MDGVGDLPPAPESSPAAPSAELGPHRCLRRTLIRDGYEAFSSVLGALEEGEVRRRGEDQRPGIIFFSAAERASFMRFFRSWLMA